MQVAVLFIVVIVAMLELNEMEQVIEGMVPIGCRRITGATNQS